MRTHYLFSVAGLAIAAPFAVHAQSTGTLESEKVIIVTATTNKNGVGGVVIPNDPKAKQVLTQESISHIRPGQSVDDIINLIPGVSFTNNDPYGSAGGTLIIRGFDASRISQTFDGIPLNDTGNYALYSNQQIDPELIEQVSVNLGTTDVDSPTASASGSTVNYRTVNPTDKMGARFQASFGDYSYGRFFGQFNTGVFTSIGTKAWIAASSSKNNNVFNDYGKINKQQYNGKLYQPLGNNGDFISLAGHYNVNLNNFFGSVPLRYDTVQSPTNSAVRVAGPLSANRFPFSQSEAFYHIAPCTTAAGVAGTADAASSCGTLFDYRYNPSDTGNIRINSKFTLAQGLVLTIDPSYQYVKANGGGTATANEVLNAKVNGQTLAIPGYFGGSPYVGIDLNGDGDKLDKVTVSAPSETRTRRYGVIAGLRWDFATGQSVRVNYTHDYGNHRQTGEITFLNASGVPITPFPQLNPIVGSSGFTIQKRDRQSLAILDQVSGEYSGKFIDNKLQVKLGLRAPYFKRDLNNYCFTTSGSGNVDCLGLGNTAGNTAYAAINPNAAAPQERILKYNRVLPNLGLTYKFGPSSSFFASFSQGMQVPGTDNLYNSFFYAVGTAGATPAPETTDNFDAGLRYNTRNIALSFGPWYTRFTNRLASAYDPVLDITVYRNLGSVDKYGVDGSISYRPIPQLLVYFGAEVLKSKIQSNVNLGKATVASGGYAVGDQIFAKTAGRFESGSANLLLVGRVQGDFGPLELGAQAKYTGSRYVNDQNLPVVQCTAAFVNQTICTGTQYQVYGAKAPGYTTVDLDARFTLDRVGLNKKSYIQLNVTNLFNEIFVGNFGGSLSNTGVNFVQIGTPRAVSGTLNIAF